ncbi:MAG: right-handed parallel beta-helix repeat-containing protein [Thermoplasmata archaeon]|nr:MAG: right-handed parallel beta-helix repeat-containing protein [Thermoplasmata archaeon]
MRRIGKISSIFMCLLMIAMVFCVAVNVSSEEPGDPGHPEVPLVPDIGDEDWRVEGTGTYFEITDSDYLNITMTSSEIVHVYLESIPKVISYSIESESMATCTDLTFTGFEASKTYYRYQDGYLQGEFTTDELGSYFYTQDITVPHHIFIQETESTIYIDPQGNVVPSTAPISRAGNIYTITGNIYESIYIQKSGITLDGSGHSVTGSGSGYGIYGSTVDRIAIKNVVVSGFTYGIYLDRSNSNTISGNIIPGNVYGIYLGQSVSNTISGNTVSGNGFGIRLAWNSDSNTISGNTVSGNYWYGIRLYSNSNYNTVSGNTVSGNNQGIFLYSENNDNTISGNTILGNNKEGIILGYKSNGNAISGNTVTSSGTYGIHLYEFSSDNTISGNTVSGGNYCIWLFYSDGNTVSGNTVSGSNVAGIHVSFSINNFVSGNTATGNRDGIYLSQSTSNTVSGNIISGGNDYSLFIHFSDSNTITGNTVSDSIVWAIYLHYSNSNTIYHNNFINNANQLYRIGSQNTWDNGAGEGNHWSDYTGLDDGSNGRVAGDGVGDTDIPHPYPGGVDWYPLMEPWIPDPVDAIERLKQYIEDLDLVNGLKNSLLSQLDAAANALANDQYHTAVNILNAFINHVEALENAGKLTEEEANFIISNAQKIIALIES